MSLSRFGERRARDAAAHESSAAPSSYRLEVAHEHHLLDSFCAALTEGTLAHAIQVPVSRIVRQNEEDLTETARVLHDADPSGSLSS